MRHIPKAFLVVVVAFAAFPSLASASWREFVPTPYETGADLDVYATYESDNDKVNGRGQDWWDKYIKEKLTFYSVGYSFHPRFITYRLSLSGSLKQEDYENSSIEHTGWSNLYGVEYDATLDALPEHPYNLRLFARRLEPLYRQQFATYTNNVESSYGAILRYRTKPYFFSARYIEESIDSSLDSSDVKYLGVEGDYYKEFQNGNLFSLNALFNRRSFDSSSEGSGEADEYSISNTINLWPVNLTSSVTGFGVRQDNPASGSLETDQLAWLERLNANLPLNFTTDLSYSYTKTDYTLGATETFPANNTSNNDKRVDLNISHTLYRSLQSRYAFYHDSLSSSGGDTKTEYNALSFLYTKDIPKGRLSAGLNLSTLLTDTSGSIMVTNEPHTILVPGAFLLNSQNVDPSTLRVWLKSPRPPFDFVLLQETVNYTVLLLGNTLQVTIFNLPPGFAMGQTYAFVVSYSLIPAMFKARTDSWGYNVGFDLFNNMVRPYYIYGRSKTEVLSGDYPGVPPESTWNTVGVLFQKEPFRALAEYQRQDSNVSPYSQWKGEITYTEDIAETTRAFAGVTYTDTSYSQTESYQGYGFRTLVVSGNMLHRLPAEHLFLSAGGSYSNYSGQTNGSTYSANAALQWKVAKLTLSLGASVSHSDSEPQATAATATTRTHQYYFLNVKRKLF